MSVFTNPASRAPEQAGQYVDAVLGLLGDQDPLQVLGATPAQVAIAWVLAQGEDLVPIPGTRRVGRLEENAAAAELALDAGDLRELDEVSTAVGDRYANMTTINR